ncbi:MAG: HAD family hydrolase [Anaerolineae bacterium]|nr:HAD family hydrolase [Anaerolineae bacterium]
MPKTRTVFFDAWHTLFTVRAHGPERLATALRALDLTASEDDIRTAIDETRLRLKALNLPFVATPEHERDWMTTQSRLMLEALGHDPALAEALTAHSWYVPYCILYDDSLAALDAVAARAGSVALLSNAFPSLLDALAHLGIVGRFDPLVISAFEGVEKPDPAIYHAALRAAAVAPEEAVFVDDLAENVAAADALGMTGVLIDRDASHLGTALRRITRLTDIVAFLE